MNKMFHYLSDYKRESVLAPLFKMLEVTFDLFVPLVMADIVNVVSRPTISTTSSCGAASCCFGHQPALRSLTAQYFGQSRVTSTGLRHALFEQYPDAELFRDGHHGHQHPHHPMTSDVNQVQSGLNLFLRLFLRSPFVVIGAMIMAFTVNFRAASSSWWLSRC